MFAIVKTREELLASGWRDDGAALEGCPGTNTYAMSEDMLLQCGRLVAITPHERAHGEWTVIGSRDWWYWQADMFRVMAPTLAALLPQTPYSLRLTDADGSAMPDSLGQWLTITRRFEYSSMVNVAESPLYAVWSSRFALPTHEEAPPVGESPPTWTTADHGEEPAEERVRREPGTPNLVMVAFRDAQLVDAMAMVTCGFELETQATEGHTWEGLEEYDGDFDEDSWREAVDDRTQQWCGDIERIMNEWSVSDMPAWLSELPNDRKRREVLHTIGATSLRTLVDKGIMENDDADSIEEGFRDSAAEDVDRGDYTDRTSPADYMDSNHNIPRHVEVVQDGSVRGFEFRTRGGRTPEEFNEAARGVFKLDHEIDTGCSFHVHIGVKGLKHRYGETMQQALTDYLIEHTAELPVDVRERWEKVRQNRFFQPGVQRDKYSFVHAHQQGTWEFRCFGNIKNADDGQRCLELAVRAMQHAYKVLTGQERLVADRLMLDNQNWRTLAERAMQRGETMTEAAREFSVDEVA